MVAGRFTAQTVPTGSGLSIDSLYGTRGIPVPVTPGNVGVCLSGGGSRALSAGMGQLRALRHLGLLGQVKALSTVSGGSWIGVPYVYLPSRAAPDADYLGPFVADQGALTLADLAALPEGNAGGAVTDRAFDLELLAFFALLLYEIADVPANALWQTLIALHILKPHGLSEPAADLMPNDTMSLDAGSVAADVTNATLNPALADETIRLFASGPARTSRPYLICNVSMLLDQSEAVTRLGRTPRLRDLPLLPVAGLQTGGLLAGVLGLPGGLDANDRPVGGGAVTAFGYGSTYEGGSNGKAQVAQTRQWSLTDAVGCSSAAFAYDLRDRLAIWERDPWTFVGLVLREIATILRWIGQHLDDAMHARAMEWVHGHARLSQADAARHVPGALLSDLDALIPSYQYWSPVDPGVLSTPLPTWLADGGSMDNTGIAGLLAYTDIQSVVSFVNSEIPLARGTYGVADGDGFLPDTNLIVDPSIPPLFGYQPYQTGALGEGRGYVPYSVAPNPLFNAYAHNQIFPSAAFPAFLRAMGTAVGPDLTGGPAVIEQTLDVQPNVWLGVTGDRKVRVVWFHLNFVDGWEAQFAANAPVLALIQSLRAEKAFPHYDTFETNLSATDVNLLAHLTSWVAAGARESLAPLFQDAVV